MAFGISRQIGKMSRAVAGLLALISALTFSAPAPAQTNQQGLPIIPFNIVNHFNPNTPVYVYIRGQVETAIPNFPANSWVYVSDLAGDITLVPAIAPGTYVNLSVPLGSVATASLQFPKLINARIYVSFGNPSRSAAAAPPAIRLPIRHRGPVTAVRTSTSTGPRRPGTIPEIRRSGTPRGSAAM
jgi:hypothetical protein